MSYSLFVVAAHRYCKQIISVELNQVTKQLLQELTRFQERMRTKDPDKVRAWSS
jgi:hypothetical protein